MTTSAERIRAWKGPAILSYGYRPFFLLSAIWAAVAMVAWLFMLTGQAALPVTMDAVSWHANALLFGYSWAVIAGFLMTAVPNWTGRFPIVGWPLAALVGLWLIGRAVLSVSAWLPGWIVVGADLAFPLALMAAIAREVIAGRNWRNLKVLGVLMVLGAANAGYHAEAATGYAASGLSARTALGALVILITLIGGRIIPSFTRNWLAGRKSPVLPAPPDRIDNGIMALTILAVIGWMLWPGAPLTGIACLAAALANLARLARWRGLRCHAEPLVWVLHAAFGFIPLGFAAVGLAALGIGPESAAKHVWMAGAVGLTTLAVMSRASLGHSGLPLTAGGGTSAIYLAVIGAVVARALAGWWPALPGVLHLSATLWIAGMAGFAALYAPILLRPRAAPKRARKA
ncbi:MAG: nitric oxide response protein NnrS [Rhodobacteraceae bacterium HLUCCA12]|nr:MAG: nitric oxide response protein NnrS [Rhodobacteraceae bacterium HLUCCA12]